MSEDQPSPSPGAEARPDRAPTLRTPTFENRLPDEGINTSSEHPLREFAWLIVAAVVTLVAVIALVSWGARWLAPKVPFKHEVALAQRLLDGPQSPDLATRSAELQQLAHRVAAPMNLPPGMEIVVRYEDAGVINAYATVGGRVRVYRGLLAKLPSEDALAALLAHEIAHVKHRHVAASMGRGLALSLLLGVVSSDAGARVAQEALTSATGIALLGYSREQETEADDDALAALVALYGHAQGFEQLFATLGDAEREHRGAGIGVEVLRSHPLTPSRVEHARGRAKANGWSMRGATAPMPPALVVKTSPNESSR